MKYLLLVFSLFLSVNAFAASADDIIGVWWSPEQKSKIEIMKDGDRYIGKVIAIREIAKDMKVDGAPLLGYTLLKGFEFKDDKWVNGRIIDPETGKEYHCKISLQDGNILKIRGYVGISLFGRTEEFKKVEGSDPTHQQAGEPERIYKLE